MSFFISPVLNSQQFDANGDPRAGALINTYLAGTLTAVTTYKTSTGTAHSNPIVLDSSGNYPNGTQLWLLGGLAYKFVITDSTGANSRTYDNIVGVGDTSTADEWVIYSGVPTYISATSFSLDGDQTNIFQVGRRVKSTNTGGTTYSTITVSAFAAGTTTVTVVNTSGVLDSGLSAVSYGLLAEQNTSIPALPAQINPFTTTGTSTAYVGVPLSPISSYAANQSFFVTFHVASGAAPTLQISGVATPPNLVKELGDGVYANIAANDITLNHVSRVTLLSPTQALVERLPAKRISQVPFAQLTSLATGTTVLPHDDTIPQITEGDQYITLAITPTSPGSILQVDVVMFLSSSISAPITAALFRDATANALAAASQFQGTATGGVVISFRHSVISGSTAATTFRVRAGANAAGTTSFNGQSAVRLFGGVAASSITITEYLP